jgi:signal transduction histidine kinase
LKSDFLIFSAVSLAIYLLLHLLWWRRCFGLMHVLAWGGLALVLPLSWALTERAEIRERRYLAEPLEGFAPTYALEMSRMGHAKIGLDTPPDDAVYLGLIDAQVEWLKANPRAASVYSFRKVPGRDYLHVEGEPIQFIVACETDYDRNGSIEGETEQRVPIGEEFEETDAAMLSVFLGKPSFSQEAVVDRWGTWMSAYAPVFGPDGKVEAAIGVDFDAHEWIAAIQRARASVLAFAGLVVLFIAGGVSVASNQIMLQSSLRDREVAEVSRVAKEKFETLVNSIEGVVFEWVPAEGRYAFVSAQAERILGRPFAYWLEEKGRWEGHLHPDDREWAIERRGAVASSLATYTFEYRAYGPDERIVWIRETGNPVVDAEGKISLLRGVLTDITEHKLSAEELEKTHRQLVDTSRRAGMAEVATGVLHNVGNVLNSVNVASTLIHQKLNGSRIGSLGQLAALLKSQDGKLTTFFETDPRGKLVPDYLENLARHLHLEQAEVLTEVDKLVKNIEHIKNIVDLQQNYARTGGTMEPLDLVDLTEDALGINAASLTRHRIKLIKRFEESLPPVLADRNKVLQILVNLIRNAKHAVDDSDGERRMLGIAIQRHGEDRVRITVADTGVGIAADNMSRLFSHGFTTRKDGHGFGLHSSEAAAREMGGTLTAHSDGPGRGAMFTLELGVFFAKTGVDVVAAPPPILSHDEAA